MCGIAGIVSLTGERIPNLERKLSLMNRLLAHRGPDGEGLWLHRDQLAGFAHRRLSIIDQVAGAQPMTHPSGSAITFNGEIYNYLEIKAQDLGDRELRTRSDTEVLIQSYLKFGDSALQRLRGMWSFAIWDEERSRLLCSRDRFGIKPFYYTIQRNQFYFASEIKALLAFLDDIQIDRESLKDYLAFQFVLDGKTLFKGIEELKPGHQLSIEAGGRSIAQPKVRQYWEVYYEKDGTKSEADCFSDVREMLEDSVALHLRSDVPVGAYVSGGRDSGVIAALAAKQSTSPLACFTGRFPIGSAYDESRYARDLTDQYGAELHTVDLSSRDFVDSIEKIIYHLDVPVAGPGSFPQFHVSKLASKHRKVVLGGQGGDEIFGGYARYLIAYFEQCIKGAINGTLRNGNFVVTYESIIPNLTLLKEYQPLLQQFWRQGLFESMDRRYFQLVNRSPELSNEVRWDQLGDYSPFDSFQKIFLGKNVKHEAYFDLMTNFDFKTLLPALLHVEDRVSMAHGLEARVPFLDHPLVECLARIPADIKFKDGELKRLLTRGFNDVLPSSIVGRKDKMGFPVPLSEWLQGDLAEFARDLFSSDRAKSRSYVDNDAVLKGLHSEPRYGRKVWGFLSLELWSRCFLDRFAEYRKMRLDCE